MSAERLVGHGVPLVEPSKKTCRPESVLVVALYYKAWKNGRSLQLNGLELRRIDLEQRQDRRRDLGERHRSFDGGRRLPGNRHQQWHMGLVLAESSVLREDRARETRFVIHADIGRDEDIGHSAIHSRI